MLYTPLTKKAMQIAYAAHHGQTDKGGFPYIFHPYHLAEQMKDEVSVCVALLHDVAEDTPITIKNLERDFPKAVTDALRLLTHEKGTDYFAYVRAIRQNPVAKAVKLADLAHNTDVTRLCDCADADMKQLARRQEKYCKAKAILEGCPFLVEQIEPRTACLHPTELGQSFLQFVDWEKDDSGAVVGMQVLCDLGHGYGFDCGKQTVILRPGQDFSFEHAYTDTGEGGSDWSDAVCEIKVRLISVETL